MIKMKKTRLSFVLSLIALALSIIALIRTFVN